MTSKAPGPMSVVEGTSPESLNPPFDQSSKDTVEAVDCTIGITSHWTNLKGDGGDESTFTTHLLNAPSGLEGTPESLGANHLRIHTVECDDDLSPYLHLQVALGGQVRRGSLEHHDELHGASEVRHLNRDVKGPGTGGIRHHLEGLNGLDAVTQLQKEIRSIERGTIVRIDETSLEAPLRAAKAREFPSAAVMVRVVA